MGTTEKTFMPASADMPSDNQRRFLRYFTATLIDLVVLGLFNQFWDKVYVDTFTTALLAAVLLQILLKLTIAAEHWVARFFNARSGCFMKFMRFFGAWLVLFGSKFVILEAVSLAFGDNVRFTGALHGLVTLIVVVVVMLLAEELVLRFYRKLA